MEALSPEREAIVRRLKLQGAVQVLPSRYTGAGGAGPAVEAEAETEAASPVPEPESAGAGAEAGAGAGAGAGQREEDLAPDRPYQGVHEYLALERLRKQLKNVAEMGAGVTPDVPEALRRRLEAHENGTIPMAKWYKKRAADYEKEAEERAREEAEWYFPTRERAGARDRDINMVQHIEDHLTHEHLRKMNPGTFSVRQRFRNFKEDMRDHWGRRIVGLTPIIGPVIEQAVDRGDSATARDALLGMSQVQQDNELADQSRSQAQAVDKTMDAGWIKAGVGTVTSVASILSPIPGVGTAVNKGAGKLVDWAYSDSRSTVQGMTARMKARRDMRKEEFRDYEDEQEYILLDTLAEQFQKGGQGDEDSGMMSTLTPELQRRVMAHIRGMIGNRKEMAKRAGNLRKEREQQFKAGQEPKPETGLLAKFKRLFSRS